MPTWHRKFRDFFKRANCLQPALTTKNEAADIIVCTASLSVEGTKVPIARSHTNLYDNDKEKVGQDNPKPAAYSQPTTECECLCDCHCQDPSQLCDTAPTPIFQLPCAAQRHYVLDSTELAESAQLTITDPLCKAYSCNTFKAGIPIRIDTATSSTQTDAAPTYHSAEPCCPMRLLNELCLLEVLGAGGFGVTFGGIWGAGSRVAVKIICSKPSRTPLTGSRDVQAHHTRHEERASNQRMLDSVRSPGDANLKLMCQPRSAVQQARGVINGYDDPAVLCKNALINLQPIDFLDSFEQESSPSVADAAVATGCDEMYSSGVEAQLCRDMKHPHIVNTFKTRTAQLDVAFFAAVECADMTPAARDATLQSVYQRHSGLLQTQMLNTLEGFKSQVDNILQTYRHTTPLTRAARNGSVLESSSVGRLTNSNHNSSRSKLSADGFELCNCSTEDAISWQEILDLVKAQPGDELTVLIMSRCELGTLDEAIVSGGVFGLPYEGPPKNRTEHQRLRALLTTASEMAQGLNYLHTDMKVVHGDIKPSNVLLTDSRRDIRGFTVKLGDFGLSVPLPENTSCNLGSKELPKLRGTAPFMAPEVLLRQPLTPAADVYAFGITLWTMCFAEPPYRGIDTHHVIRGVLSQWMRPDWPANIHPHLRQLYLACVAHDPEVRPSAAQVASYLQHYDRHLAYSYLNATAAAVPAAVPPMATTRVYTHDDFVQGGNAVAAASEPGQL